MSVKISVDKKAAVDVQADAVAFFFEKKLDDKSLSVIKTIQPNIDKIVSARKFDGSSSSCLVTPSIGKQTFVALVGLGAKKDGKLDIQNFRTGIGSLVRECEANSIETLSLELPDSKLFDVSAEYLAQQAGSIFVMANYKFDTFLTSKSEKEKKLTVLVSTSDVKIKAGLEKGLQIGECVNNARGYIDSPPNVLTPIDFADKAQVIAKKCGLKYSAMNEEKIKEIGMGGLAAVSSGSEQECRFVIMEYDCKQKNAPTLGFVGKGITFDSGGLSLKPSEYMETMKEDMSGAAAVLSAMQAISQLKLNVNVKAFMPLAENTPSGSSSKPGDIVKFYNGKTAEIINTDAEGRLILADALSYATKNYKLDAIIDLATLTGACQYALGPFFTGLFSQSEKFTQQVTEAANLSGDYVWRLPLTDNFRPANKCAVADLSNCGSKKYFAGATTAAFFLESFIENKTPWVHLDIAGTAFNVPDITYFRPSTATGVGVRLLVELATNWNA